MSAGGGGRRVHRGLGAAAFIPAAAARAVVDEPLLRDTEWMCAALAISKPTFRRALRNGQIGPAAIAFGRMLRFSELEVRRWIAAGCPRREKWIASNGGETRQ